MSHSFTFVTFVSFPLIGAGWNNKMNISMRRNTSKSNIIHRNKTISLLNSLIRRVIASFCEEYVAISRRDKCLCLTCFHAHICRFNRAFLIKSQNWKSTFEATYLLPWQINLPSCCIKCLWKSLILLLIAFFCLLKNKLLSRTENLQVFILCNSCSFLL